MTYEQKKQLIEKLVEDLNNYTVEYDKGTPVISDTNWDDLYFKLKELEQETGFLLPTSPTNSIHFKTVSKLEKKAHNHDMLSLDKTKDIKDIETFIDKKEYLIMFKLDGLTCSLTYLNGELISAETRGDGFVGEDILHNIMVVPSVPKKIPVQEKVVIDGEIICKYSDFEDFKNEYKNPRNFAAGSIRQLDSKETAKRKLTFIAWDVVEGINYDSLNTRFDVIKEWGFEVVPNILSCDSVNNAIETLNKIREVDYFKDFPIDGYVFKFNSVAYGKQLGQTAHHFKNAKAFKFKDTIYTSQLKNIEWTIGKSGVLTPVAVFTPIEIEGTKVERASLHNISILNQIFNGKPYNNQIVEIVKRNQIIPQIEKASLIRDKNTLALPDEFQIPKICPYCGHPTVQTETETSIVLKCTNSQCEGQLVNKLTHYCSKKGMDIKGLSKSTLQKLIDWEWITSLTDIYDLEKYRIEWENKSGFGPKSVDKILKAINESKECFFWQFIAAIGIPEIGVNMAKELNKYFDSWELFRRATKDSDYHFWGLPGFGLEIDEKIKNFNYTEADALIAQGIIFKQKIETKVEEKTLDGISVVITGKLIEFKNRAELKAAIEAHGGHVANSVTQKVHYLINNDIESTSSKNKKAKELGIKIISDKDFKEKFLTK